MTAITSSPSLLAKSTTTAIGIGNIAGLFDEAKKILDGMGAKYVAIELDADPDGKAIRAEMGDLVGRTSVPAIWIGKQFVGGCNDGPMGGLKPLKESGKLEELLREVG